MVLKLGTKGKLSLSFEQSRKLYTLIVYIIIVLVKAMIKIIFNDNIHSIKVRKTAS